METILYIWMAIIALLTFSTALMLTRIGLNCVRVERKLTREIDAIWGNCDD